MHLDKTKAKLLALAMAGSTMMVWTGCDSHEEHSHADAGVQAHSSPFPTCDAVIKACHEFDTGDPGPIYECHNTGHGATSDADCVPIKESCLATCAAARADAGATGDGG